MTTHTVHTDTHKAMPSLFMFYQTLRRQICHLHVWLAKMCLFNDKVSAITFHKPRDRDAANGEENSVRKCFFLLLFRETIAETNNFAWHEIEREEGNQMPQTVTRELANTSLAQDGVAYVGPGLDFMKRRQLIKMNRAHTEIQYCSPLTSQAFVQRCMNCNECELYHSDEKNSSEINKEEIKELIQTGSCYHNVHAPLKSEISSFLYESSVMTL